MPRVMASGVQSLGAVGAVAALGREDDVAAAGREDAAEALLGEAVAAGGVEEGDARVDGGEDDALRLAVGDARVAEAAAAEAEAGDVKAGVAECSALHRSASLPVDGRGERRKGERDRAVASPGRSAALRGPRRP